MRNMWRNFLSLRKINLLVAGFFTIILTLTAFYTYGVAKKHFKQQDIEQIKGDILELGYSLISSIERDGVEGSLSLLYKSLATHKEYQSLSIAMGNKIVLSTDKNQINRVYENGLHVDDISSYSLREDMVFYSDFNYFDREKQVEFNLIVNLNDEYLLSAEKGVQTMIATFVFYFILILLTFLLFLYFLNVYPLIKLKNCIEKQECESSNFFIKEHFFLYHSLMDKYNEITLLNKTLEEKVENRTKLLSQTNILFKEAQKLARIGNWEWNISDNSVVWSDEIFTIFGFETQKFTPTYDAFMNSVHIDDRSFVKNALDRALEGREDYAIHHKIVLPGGVQKVVYENGRVEYDDMGNPVRMVGTVQDITERYKKSQELEFQSKLLNSVTDSIFVHNLDGTFIYVNEAAYLNRGYTKEELMNMRVQELDYHDEKSSHEVYEENMKNINKQLKEKRQAIFEVLHKTKNGEIIPLEITCRLIQEDNKNYIISIARDISERKFMSKSLEISEMKYKNLVENSQIGIFNINSEGEIFYANEALLKIMEYESQEEMYKYKIIAMYKNSEQHTQLIQQLLENGKVDGMEIVVLTKNNKEKIVQVSAHFEDNIISGIIMDITESKKAIEEITKLSKAIENIDDIIMITDINGVFTFVNDAFIVHTGYSSAESIGRNASMLKSGKQDKKFYKAMWEAILSDRPFRELFVNRKKSGELYYEEKTISPIENDDGVITSFVSTGKDITQRIEMEYNLEKMASTDSLTGIFNRHKFEELFKIELERVLRYKNPLTLIMFDIDHFKNVNDTYGHDVGDTVLKNIVDTVNKNIRNIDIFVRWGGEEFIVLCPQTDSLSAAILAEKLRAAIDDASFDKVENITCSFGVASFKDNESKDSFIKRTDNALYKAKDEGRNRVVVV